MKLIKNLEEFAQITKEGKVVIFPTDTVWGIGCNVESRDAIHKLYSIKKREANKPTAILVGSQQLAEKYGIFNEQSQKIIEAHWPGALTVVVQATHRVPSEIQGKTGTVGIRYPKFEFIEQLTQQLRAGIVAGSANFAGENPPFKKEDLNQDLLALVDAIYDGECGGETPSTVIDTTGERFKIIRQGLIHIPHV